VKTSKGAGITSLKGKTYILEEEKRREEREEVFIEGRGGMKPPIFAFGAASKHIREFAS